MATGEGQMFVEIWEALEPEERVSFVTGFSLPTPHEMRAYYFAHVLSKGSSPKFRLYKKNIVLLTFREHQIWDNARYLIRDNPLWIPLFNLEQELKEELKEIRNDNNLPRTD